MKKLALHQLKNAVGNGLWQLLPSLATLLLSFVIVRLYGASVWGTLVSVVVVQQIVCSILSWGNKDYLQREIASNNAKFNAAFTAFFRERLFLFVAVAAVAYFLDIVPSAYYIAFVLLVFGRFLQQGFDILIIRERQFKWAVALEMLMLLLQVLGILTLHGLKMDNLQGLFLILWLPLVLKGFILLVVFRKSFVFAKPDVFFLSKSFSFAMLSLSGLVHSKIDLLLISVALDHETLGKYQIITAFLWNIQSVALYVSSPYIHNFYRLNTAAQSNYALLLKRLGLVVVPVGVAVMVLLLHFAFRIGVGFSITVASLLFGAASFIYLPWILRMNGQKKENRVLLINLFGTVLLILLILTVNKIWGLTLERTIWLVAIHQLFLTLVAYAANKKPKVWVQN